MKNQSAAKELTFGDLVPNPKQRRWLTPQPPESTVSPHLVDPAQTVLFDARRDWSRFTVGSMERLPALTPAAEALLEDFRRHAGAHGWNPTPRNAAAMTLRILLGWLGAEAPLHEADIRGRRSLPHRRHPARAAVPRRLRHGRPRPGPPRRSGPARSRSAHRRPTRPHHQRIALLGTGSPR
jgi:hypothetical protein